MALKKREINKEKEVENEVDKNEEKNEVEVKEKPVKINNTQNIIKSLLISLITMIVLTGGFIIYLKYKQPEVYEDRIAKYFAPSIPVSTPIEANEKPVEKTDAKEVPIYERLSELQDKLSGDELFFLEGLKRRADLEKIVEKNPKLENVKDYYDEPIGQMVKRISMNSQVVLFINTDEEKSKVARLAVSVSKVPFGVMEVNTEPRAGEIAEALFRMTAQRSFPYIFINGNFFGTSLDLKNIMESHKYERMLEEGKDEWLRRKEKYQKTIEKRKMEKEEKEKRKLEKIMKKLEELN